MRTDLPCVCGHPYDAHSRRYRYCIPCDQQRPVLSQCWRYQPPEEETTMDETCPHGFVTVRHCLECLATALDREAADLERIVQERRRRCPDCGGTALSPYPQDGGSCPHCVGGFLP